jgi:hypothetical protein
VGIARRGRRGGRECVRHGALEGYDLEASGLDLKFLIQDSFFLTKELLELDISGKATTSSWMNRLPISATFFHDTIKDSSSASNNVEVAGRPAWFHLTRTP